MIEPTDPADIDAPDLVSSVTRDLSRRDLVLSVLELAGAVALVIVVVLTPDRPTWRSVSGPVASGSHSVA